MPNIKPKTLYVTLSMLMIGLVVLVWGVLMLYERSRSDALLMQQAGAAARRIGREAAAVVEAELRPARVSLTLLVKGSLGNAASDAERLQALPQMAAALAGNASVSAVYAGSTAGGFVLLRRLEDAATRKRMGAPNAAVWALQLVARRGNSVSGSFRFYDAGLHELLRVERPEYDFDPRTRPWFELARGAAGHAVVQTAPYRFFTTGESGVTLAQSAGEAVVGADVSLRALGEMLTKPQISRSAQLLIATAGGGIVAEAHGKASAAPLDGQNLALVTEAGAPLMRALWQRRDGQGQIDALQTVDGTEWVSHALPLPGTVESGTPFWLLMAAPREELQAFQIESRRHGFYISLALMLLLLPVVHLFADRVSRPLRQLARQAEAIEHFEFGGADPKRSRIREVDRLAVAMTAMKHSLRRFLDISSALSAEQDFDALLDLILRETIAVTGASGGAVHLLSDDERTLMPASARLNGQVLPEAGKRWSLDVAESVGAPVQALRADDAVQVELRWDEPSHVAAYGHLFSNLATSRLRLLSLPLKNRENEIVGTLTLSFPLPAQGRPEPLGEARVAFVRALSGTAAIALDNQLLQRARKALLESFIQLVAGAIDAKSPYTGGHCQRVPELTKMLAQAACDATEGPFADFALDARQWEALHIAAWLHDCGKVTTPEFVVDKATKLETIYNRIHEVRTRFEVIKRDVLIEQLRAESGAEGAARAEAASAPALAALDDDFAFLAAANLGGETLAPEAVERLRRIGARRWQRTLDDSLGLSPAEAARQPRPRPTLPVVETLLQDRPEHVVPRPVPDQLAHVNRWGFRMQQPEHLYNRGELHNLSVTRGTLTAEERYKINDHIVQTIKMLEELPFPRHLRSVPEIAGGHHERVDGHGYPRGRTAAQMSPQARMMAIADVFEALTANDRPYKPGKSLAEALGLMQRMVREQHLDADLFALFLRSGVCLDYARRFMPRDLVDVTDVEAYLL